MTWLAPLLALLLGVVFGAALLVLVLLRLAKRNPARIVTGIVCEDDEGTYWWVRIEDTSNPGSELASVGYDELLPSVVASALDEWHRSGDDEPPPPTPPETPAATSEELN